jgi:hypothetical protein
MHETFTFDGPQVGSCGVAINGEPADGELAEFPSGTMLMIGLAGEGRQLRHLDRRVRVASDARQRWVADVYRIADELGTLAGGIDDLGSINRSRAPKRRRGVRDGSVSHGNGTFFRRDRRRFLWPCPSCTARVTRGST